MLLTLRSDDRPPNTARNVAVVDLPGQLELHEVERDVVLSSTEAPKQAPAKAPKKTPAKSCATVEEMGKAFKGRILKETLAVRRIIQRHFSINGASRIRELPPEQFCSHGFVIGKASEAGFGNEMYKILTAAALSVMLNRSLIIGQTRHIATELFGKPENLQSRPNVFGELMRILISPSRDVEEAVDWVIGGGKDPDITLHMRMLMNRSLRAAQAALNCVRRATRNLQQGSKPRVVVISDSPSFVKFITPNISEFAEVLHFDYKLFSARAKHAVVSGAHRRVGTTYAQLIAALAAANSIGENSTASSFSFLSSFQGNLLAEGLKLQIGWGHAWNRFAGPLSCRGQPNQCALTPLLPPAWWDGLWQSPIPRDINRLEQYGVQLTGFGTTDENQIRSFCSTRKTIVKTISYI
ncbi:hypothetical protein COLO4_13307 [Corchorus olitorius]|uniref:Uncharacterized protein n=1 Tax=Corchorus olitorius TaxID=93759 RepID=A0A1R3JX33_9ROSI|nr:hypothetical protein COLO4_13307 [Corchorus olitorius]